MRFGYTGIKLFWKKFANTNSISKTKIWLFTYLYLVHCNHKCHHYGVNTQWIENRRNLSVLNIHRLLGLLFPQKNTMYQKLFKCYLRDKSIHGHMSYMQNCHLLYLRLWCLLMGRGNIKGQSISKSVSLKEAEYFIYVTKAALSCL